MGSLGKFFKQKADTPADALRKLTETEDILLKKQEFIESKIAMEVAQAKQFGMKNKRAAINCLKRKQMYQKKLQQIDGTIMTIDNQRNALDEAMLNSTTISAMGSANEALKKINKKLDVDKVHDVMDDIADQQAMTQEIADALAGPIGNADFDDDDLMDELRALEEEAMEDQLHDVSGVDLPSVPANEPISTRKAVRQTDEDAELTQLEAWSA